VFDSPDLYRDFMQDDHSMSRILKGGTKMPTESRVKASRRPRKSAASPKDVDTTSPSASNGMSPGVLQSESRALGKQTRTTARPATRAVAAHVIKIETASVAEATPTTAPRRSSSRTGSRIQTTLKKKARAHLPAPSQLREEIAVRAYHRFLERMRTGAPGDEGSDWRQAEIEIKSRYYE
jgi:hypothetical protein